MANLDSRTPLAEIVKFILAVGSMLALIACVLLPAFGYKPVESVGFIALVSLTTLAMTFYFGTTLGSSKKDDTINTQAAKIPPPTVPSIEVPANDPTIKS